MNTWSNALPDKTLGHGCMRWREWVISSENFAVTLGLVAMVVLPLAEIPLRAVFRHGIAGSAVITQHLTLIVGMLGAIAAAREGRLFAVSTLPQFLQGRMHKLALLASSFCAAIISAFLCYASAQFAMAEKQGGEILAYGIPIWTVELVLPIGFAAIVFRLLENSRHCGIGWRGILMLCAAALGIAAWVPISAQYVTLPALCALFVATLLGMPIFAAIGGAALILFWAKGVPIASIPLDQYRLVVNPSLPAIPLFTLAGYLLAEGGASQRLVRVLTSLTGHLRGGPAIATALICAFFTAMTGASGVTILALGGLLMPMLLTARYPEKSALGLLTGAGSLGLLFAPCLPLLLYAVIAHIPIRDMFLGGLMPGVLLTVATAWWGARQESSSITPKKFSFDEARRAIAGAKWELLLPVVAGGALFSGYATPVEASAITALYAFIVEVVVYRDLQIARDISRVMAECGIVVGGVLLVMGLALGLTNYLVDAQLPARITEWVTASIRSPWIFLLALNAFLLVLGSLMEVFSAIIVLVPLLAPLGKAYGIDPVHLGIIFLANLELGYLTPPMGMNLFLASYRFRKPFPEVCRSIVPIFLVLLIGVVLITYIPWLTTALISRGR
ncbi:MAG TPA: TRAP transporter large permease subunit [Burkholderiales bacterium]|nr:TRAP transporter large permease subunit [Burkholderiales bacterium]